MSILIDMISPFLSALFATLGFGLLYNIHGKNLITAALCGAFAWMVYLVADPFTDSMVIPYFLSGMAIAIYSEFAATICHSPVTVFLIPGIIPLVPGLTIYRTMETCLFGDVSGFAQGLVNTLKIGGAISLGLILVSSIFRLLRTTAKAKKQAQS